MLQNTSKTVETKLEQHRQLGTKSKLDILQVAQMMDQLKFAKGDRIKEQSSIFFDIPMN